MELLLNFLWLLLVMPALWVWRRRDRSLGSLRGVLVFTCGVVLLFPVVSATDDLQAMRPEMVESSPLKRALKQGTIEKASGQNQFRKSPAILTFIAVRPGIQFCGQPRVQPFFSRVGVQTRVLPTRAPPVSPSLLKRAAVTIAAN